MTSRPCWRFWLLCCCSFWGGCWKRTRAGRRKITTSFVAQAWTTKAPLFLAKTSETFQLSELQWLEWQLLLQQQGSTDFCCQRMLLDRATGSTLILFQQHHDEEDSEHSAVRKMFLQERLLEHSCDWVGRVLVNHSNAEAFVLQVAQMLGPEYCDDDHQGPLACLSQRPWTLDFCAFSDALQKTDGAKNDAKPSFTKTSLLCAVAQALAMAPAALNPKQEEPRPNQLLLVNAGPPHGLFLLHKLRHVAADKTKRRQNMFLQQWARRPFPYSSALNPTVACLVTNLVMRLAEATSSSSSSSPKILLDPTCGSGSCLAYAFYDSLDWSVIGWDNNPKCVDGTRQNLEHMLTETTNNNVVFSDGEHHRRLYEVECRDSTLPTGGGMSLHIGAVVANLPWGQNSIRYADEDWRIVQSLRHILPKGVPCAYVFSSSSFENNDRRLQQLGYEVLGVAEIPPRNFALPRGRSTQQNKKRGRKPKCVVVIAKNG